MACKERVKRLSLLRLIRVWTLIDSAVLFFGLLTALNRGEIQKAARCQMDSKRLGWIVIPGPRMLAPTAPVQGDANVA